MHCLSEPSVEEAVQGSTVAGASRASQSPSQVGNKGGIARKMGSIQDSTSVLAIQNYVEVRRAKVPRKELKIDGCMEYGQSKLIKWFRVAQVKEDLLANPPEGRLQLLVWDDKGLRGLPYVMCHAFLFSGSPVGDWRPTRRCGVR